jgi:predicted ABC-class ATPase
MPDHPWSDLNATLRRIDGKNYGAYKDLYGKYARDGGGGGNTAGAFQLAFDHIQADPFASPTRAHVTIAAGDAGFPGEFFASPVRRRAAADYLTRVFFAQCRAAGGDRGAPAGGRGGYHGEKGGAITIDCPGQHVVQRSSVVVVRVNDQDASVNHRIEAIEARFTLGMPARGRTILGAKASTILTELLPHVVSRSLFAATADLAAMRAHIFSVEDQAFLRAQLAPAGLVAFVRDGAILPRSSGSSDLPLAAAQATAFVSPESLRRKFVLPHAGDITGMAIPAGVSLIVGGGFHGKSTLLQALETGVYDRIPGDGREFVCTDPTATKIRAEDGRSVSGVDISSFINNLPGGKSTAHFSTADASGSTSQASAIVEALEVGATTLLVDEDTAATNFMIRDARMERLVKRDPITPFIHRVRALARSGVSSVLVVGGCGDYFEVADLVICMENYLPRDATQEAKEIVAATAMTSAAGSGGGGGGGGGGSSSSRSSGSSALAAAEFPFERVASRAVAHRSLNAHGGKVVARRLDCLSFGDTDIALGCVEQLCELSQVRCIADAMVKFGSRAGWCDGTTPLVRALDAIEALMDGDGGLDAVAQFDHPGNLSRPRRAELAAAINRLRGLQIVHVGTVPWAGNSSSNSKRARLADPTSL